METFEISNYFNIDVDSSCRQHEGGFISLDIDQERSKHENSTNCSVRE